MLITVQGCMSRYIMQLATCERFIKSLKCDGLTPLCHPWISEECTSTFECHDRLFVVNNVDLPINSMHQKVCLTMQSRNPCNRGCRLEDTLPGIDY